MTTTAGRGPDQFALHADACRATIAAIHDHSEDLARLFTAYEHHRQALKEEYGVTVTAEWVEFMKAAHTSWRRWQHEPRIEEILPTSLRAVG